MKEGKKVALIVQKFGGTSVGSPEKILHISDRILREKTNGNECVVVVSAMGKTTDELISLAEGVTDQPNKREMDMLLSTGEQVTISLLAMALAKKGLEAVSYTGWQAGIITEDVHGDARILNIQSEKIQAQLDAGKVVIVAGFQGRTETGEITTLGRGGSDTTAVALAAALQADKCEIYTDVTGVFTTDPRYVDGARKLSEISYDEMLELANLGAGILHPRAVEFAKNYQVTLEVRSSMEEERGTLIKEEVSMEQNLVVRGVAFEDKITRITVCDMPNCMTSLSTIFATLAENNVNVDIIIQSTTEKDTTDISFSIDSSHLKDVMEVLENNKSVLNYQFIESETGLAKVSIVGSGMASNPGVAAEMFSALANNQIEIKMVSTSEIKISTVVDEANMLKAVQVLHETFKLGQSTLKSTVQ